MRRHSTGAQPYPRIEDENSRFYHFLDDSKLMEHKKKIPINTLKEIIVDATKYADSKSSQVLFATPDDADQKTLEKIYIRAGKDLFSYFKRYCSDPAQTALDCFGKHYSDVAKQQLTYSLDQKRRMNSGWRYQFIAKDTARRTGRFDEVSDIGTSEADFNVTVRVKNSNKLVYIYVSVKNRADTLGGQDWPKAIRSLETMAKGDMNRNGPYLCVFGITIDRGLRVIKIERKSKTPYSMNTEVWMADFFWPFFSNVSYESLSKTIVDVFIERDKNRVINTEVPKKVIETFGELCSDKGLVDKDGKFNDPHKLVEFFCRKM